MGEVEMTSEPCSTGYGIGRLSGECGLGMRIVVSDRLRIANCSLKEICKEGALSKQEHIVAKKAKKRVMRPNTKAEEKELRAQSKAKRRVSKIANLTKRT